MTGIHDFHPATVIEQVGGWGEKPVSSKTCYICQGWGRGMCHLSASSWLPLQGLTELLFVPKTSQKQTGNAEKKRGGNLNNDLCNLQETSLFSDDTKPFPKAVPPTLLHSPTVQLKASRGSGIISSIRKHFHQVGCQWLCVFFILAAFYQNEQFSFLEVVAACVTTADEYGNPFWTCSFWGDPSGSWVNSDLIFGHTVFLTL